VIANRDSNVGLTLPAAIVALASRGLSRAMSAASRCLPCAARQARHASVHGEFRASSPGHLSLIRQRLLKSRVLQRSLELL